MKRTLRPSLRVPTQERLPQATAVSALLDGRDGEIRTRDLTHPKRARYQAAPRPVKSKSVWLENVLCQRTRAVTPSSLLEPLFRLAAQSLKLFIALLKQTKDLAEL